MIIGEVGLIIGKVYSVISNFSISVFFYITKQQNFFIKKLKDIIFKLIPRNLSPPF